jgi:uncharacterized heparinase superfamily protein
MHKRTCKSSVYPHLRYLEQVLTLPPNVVLRKAWRKLRHSAKRDMGRLQARWLSTTISDVTFLQALNQRFPTTQDFLRHRAVADKARFFLNSGCHQELLEATRITCPDAEQLTISAADHSCEHIFDLLGSGPTSIGDKIDWHIDFKTGHRFDPRQYYADVRSAPYPGGYDIKVPWELSRCQHFTWLGQAYWFTGDEKYAREFTAQVEDWLASNPWPWGVNWTCTMDVAIRAVNWLWGYHFFGDSPALTDSFRLAFYKSMLIHGRHIFRNLENQGDFTGNHYLSNLVGLIYLGILCPEFKEAKRWRAFGLQEMENEMFKQVYADGANFEASTSYHRLVLEFFLSPTILAQHNGHQFSAAYMERLEKMVEFVMYLTKPDGTSPLIGDNDNGRLHRLKVWDPPEREWVDFRYLLAIGSVLFRRQDFGQAAEDQWEEAIWLWGEEALTFKQSLDAQQPLALQIGSQAFPDAGLYLLRHGDNYLAVDAGSNGQNGNGGHAHNDILSFELYTQGQTWIADPGTFVYSADYNARNFFRSTGYHNTVKVDGTEQLPFSNHELWSLKANVSPQVTLWEVGDQGVRFEAEYYAYARLPKPVIHRRSIDFDAGAKRWLVDDLLSTEGIHIYELRFHCAPGIEVRHVKDLSFELHGHQARQALYFTITRLSGDVLQQELVVEDGWISLSYGSRCVAPVLCLKWQSRASTHWRTEIIAQCTEV